MNLDAIRERYQKALDAKPSKGDSTPEGIDAIVDSVCDVPELLAEVDRLTRWQTEATEVLRGLQDLGKALDLPLGEQITGQSACVAAVAPHDRTEAAEQAVQRVRELHAPMQTICVHCFARYPCTTMRALDGGEQHG